MIQNKTRQQAEQQKQKNILKQKANKPITESKNQILTWETGSKEERKEQDRDKERESEKGGGQKKAKEKQRETQKNDQQKWLSRGKNRVVQLKAKKGKQRNESKEKTQEKQKIRRV